MIKRWGLADEPAHTPLPDDDVVHSCQYENKLDAPGYRDVTLVVKVAVGVDDVRSISLALSAADSERLAADLVVGPSPCVDTRQAAGCRRERAATRLAMKDGMNS